MTERGSIVALVDCGTARWKVAVWRLGRPPVEIDSFSVELKSSGRDEILSAAVVAKERAGTRIDDWNFVGGHVLRTVPYYAEVISTCFGVMPRILDAGEEGALLKRAVLSAGYSQAETLVIDVGGGSVQIVALDSEFSTSLPIGTYSLERSFGMSWKSVPEGHLLGTFKLSSLIAREHPRLNARRLIVGSNQMASFFRAFAAYCSLESAVDYDVERCVAMYECAIHLSEDDYPEAFPEKPAFMYGASNCLAIVLAVSAALGIDKVEPTDLGLNAGLALEMLQMLEAEDGDS